MATISVIIPVFNRESELRLSLRSLATQTVLPQEIIIVDDGSEPRLPASLVQDFPDLPIRIFYQSNAGAPAARNRGFRESTGTYVIFWDADVLSEPTMLEQLAGALDEQPAASFSYCNFYFGRKKMPAQAFSLAVLRQRNYICTMSMIRRSAFPGFDESLKRFQDWDLWLTIGANGGTGVWVPEYLFRILTHGGGISTWLPRFAYRAPWKYLPPFGKKVRAYEQAKKIIIAKHHL